MPKLSSFGWRKPIRPKKSLTSFLHAALQLFAAITYTHYCFSCQVNDIAFHPVHFCLLATVGSDGKFSFWDKDARTKLKVSTCSISALCSAITSLRRTKSLHPVQVTCQCMYLPLVSAAKTTCYHSGLSKVAGCRWKSPPTSWSQLATLLDCWNESSDF